MFKKHLCVFMSALVLVTSLGFTSIKAEEKYEVWDESPFITSGFTEDDVRIAKTRRENELETYKLTAVGSNVYLAIAEIKTSKGGVNSTSKTSKLYFYTLTTVYSESKQCLHIYLKRIWEKG